MPRLALGVALAGWTAFAIGLESAEVIQKQIRPNLGYWHLRSGDHFDFFCIGFPTASKFNPHTFHSTVEYLERETDWSYSGGTDLIHSCQENCKIMRALHVTPDRGPDEIVGRATLILPGLRIHSGRCRKVNFSVEVEEQ